MGSNHRKTMWCKSPLDAKWHSISCRTCSACILFLYRWIHLCLGPKIHIVRFTTTYLSFFEVSVGYVDIYSRQRNDYYLDTYHSRLQFIHEYFCPFCSFLVFNKARRDICFPAFIELMDSIIKLSWTVNYMGMHVFYKFYLLQKINFHF